MIGGSLKEMLVKMILTLMVVAAFGGGCSYINSKLSLENDHPAEQFVEEIIEREFDIEVDFTPEAEPGDRFVT